MNYNIIINNIKSNEILWWTKEDYTFFSNEIIPNFNKFIKQALENKKLMNNFENINIILSPEKWLNTIILASLYKNEYKNLIYNIYIPELEKNKEINIKEIIKILKEKYSYNEKQIDLFIKIYKEDLEKKKSEIINEIPEKINLYASAYFWETLNKDIIPLYDLIPNRVFP